MMLHAITIGGVLVGLTSAAFGAVNVFAPGKSDAPQESQVGGCAFMVGGIALLIICLIAEIV
jgi:hypothetical protein